MSEIHNIKHDSSSQFSVRRLTASEVSEAFKLVDGQGWYMTWPKWTHMYAMLPDCFFVLVDGRDKISGTVIFVPTSPGVYNLGYIVIVDQLRGKGLGRALVSGARQMFVHNAVVVTISPGLDDFYKRIGFSYTQAQKDHVFIQMIVDRELVKSELQYLKESSHCENGDDLMVRQFEKEDLVRLSTYDSEARGYDNSKFMAAMVNFAVCFVAKINSQNKIVGYGGVYFNEKKDELVIEGLYADSDVIALMLFSSLMSAFPDKNNVKLESTVLEPFLSKFGKITAALPEKKYFIGEVPAESENKLYNCTDCDFSW